MKKLFLGLLFSVIVFLVSVQIFSKSFLPSRDKIRISCDSLKITALSNAHKVPNDLKPSFGEAVSFFPDLKNTQIELKLASISSTMQAHPEITFRNLLSKKRKFIIKVNNDFKTNKTLNYKELSNDILVGWIGHELSHIVDYQNRSFLSLIGLGINYYLSSSFRSEVENFADKSTVYRGLGKELLSGVVYSIENTEISKEYQNKLVENYYSPKELKEIIAEYEMKCR